MENQYNKDFFISYTDANRRLELNLVNAVSFVQDMITGYFSSLNSDNLVLKENNNALWVVAKTKIHFNQYPVWKDVIEGNIYTTKVKPIRVETETQFKNENEDILFYAKQESCAIDLESRKIRKIDTISYPMNIETKNSISEKTYQRLNENFSEDDKIYEQMIYSTDIDFSGHTNNVFYVRYILNALSCEFLDKHQITDFEIHYINESKEGQTLKVYRKIKENTIEFLIKEQDREIVRASLNYITINLKK